MILLKSPENDPTRHPTFYHYFFKWSLSRILNAKSINNQLFRKLFFRYFYLDTYEPKTRHSDKSAFYANVDNTIKNVEAHTAQLVVNIQEGPARRANGAEQR